MTRTAAILSTAFVLLTLVATALWPARSDESKPVSFESGSSGALDGLIFEGMFGPADGSSDRADILYFSDGYFWSKNCVPCGFAPAPYKATRTDDGFRFEGVMTSPDRGRFTYSGIVKDGEIMAEINWLKERWYWTIDKDFRFKGASVESSASTSALRAMRVALSANPDPDKCQP